MPITNLPDVNKTLARLAEHGYPARQASPHHVKIGFINYFPTKGTVYRDGALQPLPKRGFASLMWYLGKRSDLF